VFLSTSETANPAQLNDANGDDAYNMERTDEASPLQQQMDDAAQLVRVLPILAMFPIYWCLYDQQGSVWTLQATRMDLPFGIQAEQLNMVNPVQIMLLIPLFDRVIYPFLEKRSWNISPLRRMSWGMLLTAVAFSISGLVESAIQRNEVGGLPKVNVGFQLPQITILAVGEILLSVTGLEFTYSTAPVRLKAFVAALFLSTSGVGDGLAGVLYSTVFADMNRASVMHVCAALMLGNLAMFVFVAKGYEGHERFTEMEMLPRGQGAIT
jgi:proton-dependent oligopeptide transporter, POT family